jgi:hypothetical protein
MRYISIAELRSCPSPLPPLLLVCPPGDAEFSAVARRGAGAKPGNHVPRPWRHAWTFDKSLEGELPDGGCHEVLVASPRATLEAWQANGRFGAVVPLLEGDNEVRAICRLGEADRSVSEPQH